MQTNLQVKLRSSSAKKLSQGQRCKKMKVQNDKVYVLVLDFWRGEEDHRKQLFQKQKVTDWLSGYHGLPRPKILNTCDNFKGAENNPRFFRTQQTHTRWVATSSII